MSQITPEVRKRAEALPTREKRRLRRNYIMWEGRLKRGLDALRYERQLMAEAKADPDGFKDDPCKPTQENIDRYDADVAECRKKLAKATKEINDALGTTNL